MRFLLLSVFFINSLYSNYVLTGRDLIVYFPHYAVERGYSISKQLSRIANKIDYIIYAFAKPDVASARVELSEPNTDIGTKRDGRVRGNFAELLRLKKKFPHLKILLSVGGWTYKDYFNQLADAGRLSELVQSCVDILSHTTIDGKEYRYAELFDGIDIDWEFERADAEKYSAAFESFLQDVRNALSSVNRKYIYTVALQPSAYFFEGPAALNWKKIASCVDWINLMAYNFHGLWDDETNFNAPLNGMLPDDKNCINYAVKELKKEKVPLTKVALGVPFYGHSYKKVKNKNRGLYQTFKGGASAEDLGMKSLSISKPGNIRFEDIDKLLKKHGNDYVRGWDKRAHSSWFYNKKRKVFISYDDEKALKEKALYCRKKGLGGIMVWEVSGDSPKGALIEALEGALKA